MGWIATTVVLAILVGILLAVARASAAAQRRAAKALAVPGQRRSPETVATLPAVRIGARVGAAVFFLLWLLVTANSSIHQVDAGHVGVVYQFGAIIGQTDDGLVITPPWRNVKSANVQIQQHSFTDQELSSFSQETQNVYIRATLNYEVEPRDVQNLYRNIGPDYFERVIRPRVVQVFKDETVKYKAVDIAPNRERIRSSVRERLVLELQQYSIHVDDLLVDNIRFSEGFENAIEQKQIATQDALREQERVKQKEFEAQQVVATARGEADANVIRAQGQADANRLVRESLSPALIQFEAIQKLAPNIKIALIPSGQGVIIDPTTLLGAID